MSAHQAPAGAPPTHGPRIDSWTCLCGGAAELQPTGQDPTVMRCTRCGAEWACSWNRALRDADR